MHWIYLLVAGILEISFATLLKMSDGFRRIWTIRGFTLISFVSLFLLNKAPIQLAFFDKQKSLFFY
jgi:multidrug transporter EmrE-like cation transporter